MKMGNFVWDHEDGEGTVTFNENFFSADRIVRLDALVDWIAYLQGVYDAMLSINQKGGQDE
jgi:hypothetical protein